MRAPPAVRPGDAAPHEGERGGQFHVRRERLHPLDVGARRVRRAAADRSPHAELGGVAREEAGDVDDDGVVLALGGDGEDGGDGFHRRGLDGAGDRALAHRSVGVVHGAQEHGVAPAHPADHVVARGGATVAAAPGGGRRDLGGEKHLLAHLRLGDLEKHLVVDAVDGEDALVALGLLRHDLVVRLGSVRALSPAQPGVLPGAAAGIDRRLGGWRLGRRLRRGLRSLPRRRLRRRRRRGRLGERERRDGEGGEGRQQADHGGRDERPLNLTRFGASRVSSRPESIRTSVVGAFSATETSKASKWTCRANIGISKARKLTWNAKKHPSPHRLGVTSHATTEVCRRTLESPPENSLNPREAGKMDSYPCGFDSFEGAEGAFSLAVGVWAVPRRAV